MEIVSREKNSFITYNKWIDKIFFINKFSKIFMAFTALFLF